MAMAQQQVTRVILLPGSLVAVVRHEVPCAPCGLRECNQQVHHCMIQVTPDAVLARGLQLAGLRRKG